MRLSRIDTRLYALVLFSAVSYSVVHGAQASEAIPRSEHPRPMFERSAWMNLNGAWQFALKDKPDGEPRSIRFDKAIVVPFPWQSRLSGLELKKDGVGWYRRRIEVPTAWKGQRVYLRFEAVDQEATVWLDGKQVGENRVTYIPFAIDITDHVTWGQKQELVVRAVDFNSTDYPKGKQHNWYTHTGGIWQTVWLEARPGTHIDHFQVYPDIKAGTARFEIDLAGEGSVKANVAIASPDNAFPKVSGQATLTDGRGRVSLTVKVPEPKLWHPDSPHLYPAVITCQGGGATDTVKTYFGLREVSRAKWAGKDYEYILLNGEPLYLRTALDQSFNPDGIYTAPTDAFLRRDMEIAKEAGLNGLRIHIKIDEPRRLYWADKLGVIILYDIPNMGSHPPKDGKRCNWEDTWRGAIRRDFNHPCVLAWVLFNETWGIRHDATWDAWIEELYHETKRLDPTRLVEDNSPCRYDHVITDINSWHFYINDYHDARRHIRNVVKQTHPGSNFNYVKGRSQNAEPLINSEYGGISAGSGDGDISWCVKYLTNELRLHPKICGYVYTELDDIEWEHNGIVNYDRSAKEYGYDAWCPSMTLADVFAADFICMDVEPCPRCKPGQSLIVPLKFSHYDRRRIARAKLVWRLDGIDRFGEHHEGLGNGELRFVPKHYDVVDLPPIKTTLPKEQMIASLWCAVVADDGRVVARNYINVDVYDKAQPRVEVPEEHTLVVRWDPMLERVTWPPQVTPPGIAAFEKRFFERSGELTYRIELPETLKPDSIKRMVFSAEMAARAGAEKYDWPFPKGNHNYPQTQEEKFPSHIEVLLCGERVRGFVLPDDPADARGPLSHVAGVDPGSYGYLQKVTIEGEPLRRAMRACGSGDKQTLELVLRVPSDAKNKHGLAVFGDRLGRYPMDPTLKIVTRSRHGIRSGQVGRQMSWDKVVPAAMEGKPMWRYTTKRPGEDWTSPTVDDASWELGRAGFGKPGTPGARVFTKWDRREIWLRKAFTVEDADKVSAGLLTYHHDEDVEVYLNGRRILAKSGYVKTYQAELLGKEALRHLTSGRNVLAVYCRQTTGGQFIDVGLSLLKE